MKKIIGLVLAVIMVATLGLSAVSAADNGLVVDKKLTPNSDGSVNVTITITGNTQKVSTDDMGKVDVMMLLDLSSSMQNETIDEKGTTRMEVLKPAACSLVDSLLGGKNSQSEVGIITFWSECELTADLTNDAEALKTTINGLEAKNGTAMAEALATAEKTLKENGRPDAPDIIVLVTDGSPYEYDASGVRIEDRATNFSIVNSAATACKSEGTIIYTVGLGLNEETSTFLAGCATDTTKAYTSVTGSDLTNIFADLSGAISLTPSASSVKVSDFLGEGVYIPADAKVTSTSKYRPAETLVASTGSNGVVLDKIGQVPYAPSAENSETITITYTVKSMPGTTKAIIGTNNSFVDYDGANGAKQSIPLASSYEYQAQPTTQAVKKNNPKTAVDGVVPAIAVVALASAAVVLTKKRK